MSEDAEVMTEDVDVVDAIEQQTQQVDDPSSDSAVDQSTTAAAATTTGAAPPQPTTATMEEIMPSGATSTSSQVEDFIKTITIGRWKAYSEETQFMIDGLIEHRGPKKKPITGIIVIVGRFKVWAVLPKGKGKFEQIAEFHYYDLESMTRNPDEHSVAFSLRSGRVKQSSLVWTTPREVDLFCAVREAVCDITHGWPDAALPVFRGAHDEGSWKRPPQPTLAERLESNYLATCAERRIPPTEEALFFLRDAASHRKVDCDLGALPLGGDDETADFSPLILSLRFDTHFKGLFLTLDSTANSAQAAKHAASAVVAVAQLLQTNRSLTKLAITGAGDKAESAMYDVVEALHQRCNSHSVMSIDFSRTSLSAKVVLELARSFMDYAHSLLEVCLADCDISSKGVTQLIYALAITPTVSMTLTHLDLTGNRFEPQSTGTLQSLFSTLKAHSKLHKLSLGRTSVNIGAVPDIRLLPELTSVDLSGHKLEPTCVAALSPLLEFSDTLTELDLSNCQLVWEPTVRMLLDSIRKNVKGSARYCPSLNLSGNPDIKFPGPSTFYNLSGKVRGINLAGLKLKEVQWVEMVKEIAAIQGLQKLVLDDSVTGIKNPWVVVQTLAAVAKNPSLTTLSIKTGFGKPVILPFLKHLESNDHITTLSIANNSLGDTAGLAVGRLLTANTTLLNVDIDCNTNKINGFAGLLSCMEYNTTVQTIQFTEDSTREILSLSNNATKPVQERFAKILGSIQDCLSTNKAMLCIDVPFWYAGVSQLLPLPTMMEAVLLPPAPPHFIKRQQTTGTPNALADGQPQQQQQAAAPTPVVKTAPTPPPVFYAAAPNMAQGPAPAPPPRLTAPPTLSPPPAIPLKAGAASSSAFAAAAAAAASAAAAPSPRVTTMKFSGAPVNKLGGAPPLGARPQLAPPKPPGMAPLPPGMSRENSAVSPRDQLPPQLPTRTLPKPPPEEDEEEDADDHQQLEETQQEEGEIQQQQEEETQ